MGIVDDYSAVLEGLAGDAACGEALREYLCYTLQPQCLSDPAGMRVCGVCRSVCASYTTACDAGTRGLIITTTNALLNDPKLLGNAGLCVLEDHEYRTQALRDFWSPNCSNFEQDQCTSGNASSCAN